MTTQTIKVRIQRRPTLKIKMMPRFPNAYLADPGPNIGLTTVNGSAKTAMRSDAAPALDQSIKPLWTRAHEFASSIILDNGAPFKFKNSSGTAVNGMFMFSDNIVYMDGDVGGFNIRNSLAINPTALNPGFTVSLAPSGTVAQANYNLINGISDVATAGGGFNNALGIFHRFGGSAMTGGRNGIQAIINQTAITNASNPNRNYVGATIGSQTVSGDGGTNTGAGALAGYYGANYFAWLKAGALNAAVASGSEINVAVETGASTRIKTILNLLYGGVGVDAVRGSVFDSMLNMSAYAGSIGGTVGIDFNDGAGAGSFPIYSGGTLMRATIGGATPTLTNGIDISAITFSGWAFRSTLFSVDGSGNTATARLSVGGGVLPNGLSALSLTATQPSTPVAGQTAINMAVTGAGSASQNNNAMVVSYAAGYTGSSSTRTLNLTNSNAGTGNTLVPAAGGNLSVGNITAQAQTAATTIGLNVGIGGNASGGNVNAGVTGLAQIAKNAAVNIGVVGSAINTGTTPVHVGGWFHLNQTTNPSVKAALIADNGAQSDPVALFQVNGATKFQVNSLGLPITVAYTVATLPAGTQGARAHVTDATAPTFLGALTGGGAVICPVFYNGSAWVAG